MVHGGGIAVLHILGHGGEVYGVSRQAGQKLLGHHSSAYFSCPCGSLSHALVCPVLPGLISVLFGLV